jgi:hypothetical protein
MRSYNNLQNERIAMAHMESDSFNEKVIADLYLENKKNTLQRLFLSQKKQNAFIILFNDIEGNKDYIHGKLYFAMVQGKVVKTQDNKDISLDKDLLPTDIWPKDYSSLLIQILFVNEELFGYIIYDYHADQAVYPGGKELHGNVLRYGRFKKHQR